MEFALHPNLAQLAAAYDDICERSDMGMLSAVDARTAIMSLVARDDNGVQWLISPDDGGWYRRTRTGELVADEPPRSGIQTPSGWDVSDSTDPLGDPRHRVFSTAVDPLKHRSPTDLTGSTLAAASTPTSRGGLKAMGVAQRRILAVVAAALIAASAWMFLSSSDSDTPPTSVPATVTDAPAVEENPAPGG